MDWLSLIIGSAIGGIITLLVTHLYARREEKLLVRMPNQIAEELIQQLVGHRLILPEKEAEARAVTREVLSSWGSTQAEMNRASMRDFQQTDAELRSVFERLRSYIAPEERKALEEAQEAWSAFREQEVRFAGVLYEGGSIRPLIRPGRGHPKEGVQGIKKEMSAYLLSG